jgi:hypothetical protein
MPSPSQHTSEHSSEDTSDHLDMVQKGVTYAAGDAMLFSTSEKDVRLYRWPAFDSLQIATA